jgi:hypothetical protein
MGGVTVTKVEKGRPPHTTLPFLITDQQTNDGRTEANSKEYQHRSLVSY